MNRQDLESLLTELWREEERRGPITQGGLGDYNADAPTLRMLTRSLRKLTMYVLDKKEPRKRK